MTVPALAPPSPELDGLYLLGPELVAELYTPELAYASQVEAFTQLANGEAWQPDKIGGKHPGDDGTVFCYAARLGRETGPVSKFGSVNPANPGRGLPSVHATVVLLHPDTGTPVAILDGTAITARRTAAASVVAATTLVGQANHIAVLGAGEQAAAHIRALYRRLSPNTFRLWSPDIGQREDMAETLASEGLPVTAVETVEGALADADVVVTATQAVTPLFDADALSAHTLVISIGCFEPHRCEIGVDTLLRSAAVVVDHAPTAKAHCGPVVELQRRRRAPALTELGALLAGEAKVPEPGIITYLSVGLGVQDASAAWAIYRRARELNVGTTVKW